MGLIFLYGTVMICVGTKENSVRIAGVTVPVSPLLNEDEDVYTVFYTHSFTDDNMINAKRKLSEMTEIAIKTAVVPGLKKGVT